MSQLLVGVIAKKLQFQECILRVIIVDKQKLSKTISSFNYKQT
jgi:hypothetical protein